jgi:excisionase family DNA binding protein
MIFDEEALRNLIREVVRDTIREELGKLTAPVETEIFPEVMTLKETMHFLGMSRTNLYRHTSQGLIPHYKLGKFLRFRKSELLDWLSKYRVKTFDEIEVDAINYINSKGRR